MEKNMILEANMAHYNLGKETVKTISKKLDIVTLPTQEVLCLRSNFEGVSKIV